MASFVTSASSSTSIEDTSSASTTVVVTDTLISVDTLAGIAVEDDKVEEVEGAVVVVVVAGADSRRSLDISSAFCTKKKLVSYQETIRYNKQCIHTCVFHSLTCTFAALAISGTT